MLELYEYKEGTENYQFRYCTCTKCLLVHQPGMNENLRSVFGAVIDSNHAIIAVLHRPIHSSTAQSADSKKLQQSCVSFGRHFMLYGDSTQTL